MHCRHTGVSYLMLMPSLMCCAPIYRLHMNTLLYSGKAKCRVLSFLCCQGTYPAGGTGGRKTLVLSVWNSPELDSDEDDGITSLVRSMLSSLVSTSTTTAVGAVTAGSLIKGSTNLPLLVTSGKKVPSLIASSTLAKSNSGWAAASRE